MPFRKLPPQMRQDPETQDAWLVHQSERLDEHESRLKNLERGHMNTLVNMISSPVKTPLGDIPLPIAIAAAAYLVYRYPDIVLKSLGQ